MASYEPGEDLKELRRSAREATQAMSAVERAWEDAALRDEFAKAALPAAIAKSAVALGDIDVHRMAEFSYDMADAMIKARGK